METKKTTIKVLHLVGSPTSKFFFELSLLYARGVTNPEGFACKYLMAFPDGKWSVTDSLDHRTVKISRQIMENEIRGTRLVVPHMFCKLGMTSIRTYFEDILRIPVVGSPGYVMKTANNKFITKAIADSVGISTPQGIYLKNGRYDSKSVKDIGYPVIVKPNESDNSEGLSLVHHEDSLNEAIEKALEFDSTVLVEQYIPGRELRGAVVERSSGVLEVLPLIEYHVSDRKPIRTASDKLKIDEGGLPVAQSDKSEVPASVPAVLDKSLKHQIGLQMKTLHRALGCRHYSMYDFRLHTDTDTAYFLETGLFWSFSEQSMISAMLRAQGTDLTELTGEVWTSSLKRELLQPTE